MANEAWAMKIEDTLFNLFKHEMNLKYKATYKDTTITQDEEADGTPKFPTFLVRQIGVTEEGQDIAGKTINAIRPTYQITITYKGDRKVIVDMATTAVLFYKSKRFTVSNVVYTISNKIRTATFRATRIIGSGDILN